MLAREALHMALQGSPARGGVSHNCRDTVVLYWYTVLYVPYWYRIGTVLVLLHWDSGPFWLEMTGADSTISTGHSSRTRQELGKPHGRRLEFVSLSPLTEFQAENCSGALGRPRGEIAHIMSDPPRIGSTTNGLVRSVYQYR